MLQLILKVKLLSLRMPQLMLEVLLSLKMLQLMLKVMLSPMCRMPQLMLKVLLSLKVLQLKQTSAPLVRCMMVSSWPWSYKA